MFMILVRTCDQAVLNGQVWETVKQALRERVDHYFDKPMKAVYGQVGIYPCYVAVPESQTVVAGTIPRDAPTILLVTEELAVEILVGIDPRNENPQDILIGG